MTSKLVLEGTETLEEIREIIQQLRSIERRLVNGAGPDESTIDYEPDQLLSANDLLDFDKFKFEADVDRSALAVPNSKVLQYPVDFPNLLNLSSDLLSIKNNLINTVKAAINEQTLTKCFFKNDSQNTRSSPEESSERTPPRRKDSYTIHRHDKPSPSSVDPMLYASPDSIRQPNLTSTPKHDKTYSTNTYSKKASPFAMSSPRQNSNAPFVRNGNFGDDDLQETFNVPASQLTLPRPPRIHPVPLTRTDTMTMNGGHHSGTHDLHVEVPVKLHNLSMEEIQSLARLQQESLLSCGVPDRNLNKNSQEFSEPMTKSVEDDDASGSTGNGAWSNDTYSVSVSNPPSETSSSPPAGSLEDVQQESLRRSMPNLTPRNLSLAPTYTASLQRDAYYNSDLRLSQNRNRTRTLRPVHPGTERGYIGESGGYQRNSDSGLESNNMEPLKKALARADTYLQSEGIIDQSEHVNRYATYQLPKHSSQKPMPRGSRIPGPRNSFGFSSGSPPVGSGHLESSMDNDGSSRRPVTPTNGSGGARLSTYSAGIPRGQGRFQQRSGGGQN